MSAKKGSKIGEVCKLLDIQPYVLRYWETEFIALHPAKSQSGQRVYAEAEVATIRRIKELLYDEGYTIAGAKKKLESREVEAGTESKAGASKPSLFDADPPTAKSESAELAAEDEIAGEAPARLDTGSPDRIETFLRGVEEALAEARAALAILEKHPR
ncbi:MAG: MerR family transcriptional regulator [Thermoanaerobaculia bacterium]